MAGDTSNPRHILFIGVHYSPEPGGIAPYSTAVAEHFAAKGDKVTVLTGVPFLPHWRTHDGYGGEAISEEQINGVRVLRVRQYVPKRQSAVARARLEATFFARSLLALRRISKPDIAIAVVPNLSAGEVARWCARRYQIPYALVYQDLTGNAAAQSGIPGGTAVAKITARFEVSLSRGASRVGVVAPAFNDYLTSHGTSPTRVQLLRNWTHVRNPTGNRAAIRSGFNWGKDETIVLHAGNMGFKQGLENIVEAAKLAEMHDSRIRFVLMGGGNQFEHLQSIVGACPNITFLPPQPEDMLTDVLSAADVLLVNERASVINMSLPSKLTSYFVSGRPVIAAVPESGTTANELRPLGLALVVPPENPHALIKGIQQLMNDPRLASELAAAGMRYASTELSSAAALRRYDQFLTLALQASPATGN